MLPKAAATGPRTRKRGSDPAVKPWNYVMFAIIGVAFVIAICVRYHDTGELPAPPAQAAPELRSDGTWTTWVRNRWLKLLPPQRLLPSTQPTYVRKSTVSTLPVSGPCVRRTRILSGGW